MNIVAILEGIISSVPEAIALWKRIEPLVGLTPGADDTVIAAITADVPIVHEAVTLAHTAIADLIAAHQPAATL
jgi:hypothetical protein